MSANLVPHRADKRDIMLALMAALSSVTDRLSGDASAIRDVVRAAVCDTRRIGAFSGPLLVGIAKGVAQDPCAAFALAAFVFGLIVLIALQIVPVPA